MISANKEEVVLLLDCSCHDLSHILRMSYFRDEPHFVYCDTLIEQGTSFWQRVKRAFYYVFNIKRASASMDSIVLNDQGMDDLRLFTTLFQEDRMVDVFRQSGKE